MKTEKLECATLDARDGIYFAHSGQSQNEILHYHDFIMLAYVAHGEGFHDFGDTPTPISEGDIFIVNSGVPHCFYSSQRLKFIELYFCYFSPEKLKTLLNGIQNEFPELESFFNNSTIKHLETKDTAHKDIRSMFIRAIDEFMHCPPAHRFMVESYFTMLLVKVLRRYHQSMHNPVFNQNKTVDEIIRYINYNLSFNVTARSIAEAHHLSEPYICRLFKKHTGTTITQFINNLKIEKAKDLLQNTNRSVESISDTLNCNPIYLKRLFKKYTGMTLSSYRNKYHYTN